MRTVVAVRLLLFSLVLLIFSQGTFAQVGIAVSFGPPPLPVYEQPVCPQDGYLWVPGYWAYDDYDGYYWVPGTWVEPPQEGYLWTPGWWGWADNEYIFHEGYWGPEVGYYGGINYGYGYNGYGYDGGRWENGRFAYNTYVTHVNRSIIHNTYDTRVSTASESHVSYNGGPGGIEARPTPQQEAYARQRHLGPVAAQTQHVQEARGNPELRASSNRGKPPIAATSKAADFKTGVVASREAGGEYKAPPANAQRGNQARPNAGRPENTAAARPATHASELPPHTYTPPNTGNAKTDKKYQQQQEKLATQQNKEHQKLQQQQEKEHQQAAKRNYSEAQKQQMEQRHAQQTQHLEQRHATQQKQLEQRQAPHQEPHPSAPRPEEKQR